MNRRLVAALTLVVPIAQAGAGDLPSRILAQGELQDGAGRIEVRRTGKAEPVLILQGKEGRCAFRLQTWNARATPRSHVPIASLEGRRSDCSPLWQERLRGSETVRGLFKPSGGSRRGTLVFDPPARPAKASQGAIDLPVAWVRLVPQGADR